ncbi:MAG: response regulator [Coriobacteriia bacterium]
MPPPDATILVVEDTELLRRIYHDALSQRGYTVITAADGLECLNTVRSTVVDLVLLDLVMPRMSGLEVLEAMRNDPRTRDIPVIILSNLGQESDMRRGLDLGAVDYLIKNEARPTDIADRIRLALEHHADHGRAGRAMRVFVRDREGDADAIVADAHLPHRFWCPACEIELALELIPDPEREGWYSGHFVCPSCGREY